MKVKMILPALTEATSPFWRPIKYSLFPPLGLATQSTLRTLGGLPPIRRDLIKRRLYMVPNSIVVSRGCPAEQMLPALGANLSEFGRRPSRSAHEFPSGH